MQREFPSQTNYMTEIKDQNPPTIWKMNLQKKGPQVLTRI